MKKESLRDSGLTAPTTMERSFHLYRFAVDAAPTRLHSKLLHGRLGPAAEPPVDKTPARYVLVRVRQKPVTILLNHWLLSMRAS